jgi:hypothetical protein
VASGPRRKMGHSLLPGLLHVLGRSPDVLRHGGEAVRHGEQTREHQQGVEVV